MPPSDSPDLRPMGLDEADTEARMVAWLDRREGTRATLADLETAFRLITRRDPDPDGWAHFDARIARGLAFQTLVREFVDSAELPKRHSSAHCRTVRRAYRAVLGEARARKMPRLRRLFAPATRMKATMAD